MQISDCIPRRGRLRYWIAAARLIIHRRSRPVVSTNPRELRDLRKHRRCGLIGKVPIIGRSPEATYQHYGGRPCAATLQVHLAAAANVDQSGKVSAYRSMECRIWRCDKRNKKQEDTSIAEHSAI